MQLPELMRIFSAKQIYQKVCSPSLCLNYLDMRGDHARFGNLHLKAEFIIWLQKWNLPAIKLKRHNLNAALLLLLSRMCNSLSLFSNLTVALPLLLLDVFLPCRFSISSTSMLYWYKHAAESMFRRFYWCNHIAWLKQYDFCVLIPSLRLFCLRYMIIHSH